MEEQQGNAETLEDVLSSTWFLTVAESFFSFADLQNLSSVCRTCHAGINGWVQSWPGPVKGLLPFCRSQNPPKMVVFGLLRCEKPYDRDYYRNPSPILQFTFDSLTFDTLGRKLFGGFAEFPVMNSQPASLGCLGPNVCAVDDKGSKVFHCGGSMASRIQDGRWRTVADLYRRVDEPSAVTAIFDMQTASWQTLPAMPLPVSNSGICRIGSRIYIIGGECGYDPDQGFPVPQYSVQCFDLVRQDWISTAMQDYPGLAHRGYAVVATNNTTIVVAGGAMLNASADPEDGWTLQALQDAYSLDIQAGSWTRRTFLPRPVSRGLKCTGYKLGNSTGQTTVAVVVGKTCYHLLSTGQWTTRPSLARNDGYVASLEDMIHSSMLLEDKSIESSGSSATTLPSHWNSVNTYRLVDSCGELVDVYLEASSTIIMVHSKR